MSSQCYLCSGARFFKRPGAVRDDPSLEILECEECSLVFLSSHDHVGQVPYLQAGQRGLGDGSLSIDHWLRVSAGDDNRRVHYLADKIPNASVLDFGCGAGGFLSKAKSICARVAGIDTEDVFHKSYQERGLDVFGDLKAAKDSGLRWDYVTAFHVVEHLTDPISALRSLAGLLEPERDYCRSAIIDGCIADAI
jgi:SAM-dependent methyltransferase